MITTRTESTPEAVVRAESTSIRKWVDAVAKPTVFRDVVVREAEDVLVDDLRAGGDASYELGSQYTLSGRPEVYRISSILRKG